MPPALELHAVTKRYRAGASGCLASAEVVRELDLVVLEGESVALVGGSGAGKSTVLLLAAGLLLPDAGTIRWFGDSDRARSPARASYFGAWARPATRSDAKRDGLPHVQLIDTPELLPSEGILRLSRWILRCRQRNDAIVVATRDAALACDLANRVVPISGGRVLPSAPVARVARVAERMPQVL